MYNYYLYIYLFSVLKNITYIYMNNFFKSYINIYPKISSSNSYNY